MKHAALSLSYPMLQAAADLRSVAAKGFGDLSDRLGPSAKSVLRRIIFDQKCVLTPGDVAQLHGDLLLVAATPEQGFEGFVTATAMLLADRLQCGAGPDDLYWNFDAFQDHYREASSPVRAALMNGFRVAHGMRRVNLDAVPKGHDLHTYDGEDLLRLLGRIARSMTPEIRDLVCLKAPEDTRAVHRAALDNCLSTSCVLSEFGTWFPGEVVALVSQDVAHVAHAPCLALVLINAITTRDLGGKMAFCWEEQAPQIMRLQAEYRVAIVAGVRHLHEMGFDWQPYAGWTSLQLLEKAVVVPFAKA